MNTRRAGAALLATVVAIVVVAAGAAGATLTVDRLRPTAPPAGVAGIAELYVATYLSAGEGTEDRLAPLAAATPDLRGLASDERYVARAAATAVERVGPGRYEVTVGVDLLVADPTGFRPDGLQFLTVTVLDRGGRLVGHGAPRTADEMSADRPRLAATDERGATP